MLVDEVLLIFFCFGLNVRFYTRRFILLNFDSNKMYLRKKMIRCHKGLNIIVVAFFSEFLLYFILIVKLVKNRHN